MLRDTLLSLLAKLTPQAPETYLRLYNNLEARLQASITATQTQLHYEPISSGWPAHLSAWEYFVVTASDSQGRYEIMTVNQVGADVLHVTRGQEGTLAQAWDAADTILSVRLTAGILAGMGRVDEVNRFRRTQSFEQGVVVHDAARVAGRLEFGENEEPGTTVDAAEGRFRIDGTLPVNIQSPSLNLNGLEWPDTPATLEGQTLVIEGQKVVGRPSSFYLGAFAAPPMPGFASPPLVPGMTYYNLVSLRTMTWNGLDWVTNQGLVPAVEAHLTYRTAAGQTLYPLTTPDVFGNIKPLSEVPPQERVSVFLDGLKLAQDDGTGLGQYILDYATSTLELLEDPGDDSRLQMDVLVPPERMARGAISTFAVLDLDIDWTDPDLPAGMLDGTRQVFDLWYIDPQTGNREAIVSTNAPEFEVYVDGVRQRPGVSYTIADGQITFAQAPREDSVLWAVWNRSGTDEGLVVPLTWSEDPVLVGGPPWLSGNTVFVQALAQGAGGVTYTYQWMRNGSAIPGATGVSRLLNDFDAGNTLSVLVRASDGVNAPIAAVSNLIDVEPIYAPPGVQGTFPDITGTEGDAAYVLDVSPYFTGDDLTFSVSGDAGASMTGATLTVTRDTVRTATLTITASSPHGASVEHTADLSIVEANKPPVAPDDGALTITESTSQVIDFSALGSDPEGADLDLAEAPTATHGTFDQVDLEAGTARYTAPALATSASDTISYSLTDGELTDAGSIAVTVEAADVTAPTLSGLDTAEAPDRIKITSDEAASVYWRLHTSSGQTAADVRAGGGTASGNFAAAADTETTRDLDLADVAGGTYHLAFAAEDSSGNLSTVLEVAVELAAQLSSPTATQTGTTTADGSVTTDTGTGTLYAGVWPALDAPTADDIKAGTGAAYSAPDVVDPGVGSEAFAATGLLAGADYKWHFVQTVAGVDSNTVESESFTTQAASPTTSPDPINILTARYAGATPIEIAIPADAEVGDQVVIILVMPVADGNSTGAVDGWVRSEEWISLCKAVYYRKELEAADLGTMFSVVPDVPFTGVSNLYHVRGAAVDGHAFNWSKDVTSTAIAKQLTPLNGADNYLWIGVVAMADDDEVITDWPEGWTPGPTEVSGLGDGGASVGSAYLKEYNTSQEPIFSLNGIASWVLRMMAFRPSDDAPVPVAFTPFLEDSNTSLSSLNRSASATVAEGEGLFVVMLARVQGSSTNLDQDPNMVIFEWDRDGVIETIPTQEVLENWQGAVGAGFLSAPSPGTGTAIQRTPNSSNTYSASIQALVLQNHAAALHQQVEAVAPTDGDVTLNFTAVPEGALIVIGVAAEYIDGTLVITPPGTITPLLDPNGDGVQLSQESPTYGSYQRLDYVENVAAGDHSFTYSFAGTGHGALVGYVIPKAE